MYLFEHLPVEKLSPWITLLCVEHVAMTPPQSASSLIRRPVLALIATSPPWAMMTAKETRQRSLNSDDRDRFERSAAHYLRDCFRRPAVVRVSEFAVLLQRNPEYLSRRAVLLFGQTL